REVPGTLAHDVETAITSNIANLHVHAELTHRPLLANFSRDAFSLHHCRAVDHLFCQHFQTQIAVQRRDRVIPRAITHDIELLVVAYPTLVAVEYLQRR